jgi:hypothetical protein
METAWSLTNKVNKKQCLGKVYNHLMPLERLTLLPLLKDWHLL